MYDVLTSQFNEALTREGNTVTDSTGTTSYACIFRKNSDKNSSDNKLTIFYPTSEAIEQGQLLKYGGRYFLTLNRETIENKIYNKSDLLETNTLIHTIVVADSSQNTGYELYVRAYAEDLSSVGTTGSAQISIVGGNIRFLAQDNADSRKLAINSMFTALGGTWKIINLYYKGGICYVYVERDTDSVSAPVYSVSVTGGDEVTMEESTPFSATATITDGATTTTILNSTFEWTSSDTSIATVSNTGVVTGIAEGIVTISARWIEHDVVSTRSITVKSNVVINYNAVITGRGSIRTGTGYSYTVTFTDSTGTAVTLTPVWSFTMNTTDPTLISGITLSYPESNKCRVTVASNDDLTGYVITLKVKDSDNLCEATYDIEIT